MAKPKFILVAASLQQNSLNKKFIKNAYEILKAEDPTSEARLLSFNDYPLPVYDADVEAKGIPEAAKALAKEVSGSDAIIISTPEYNGGMPGPFKNALDWVSRIKPMPWAGKHVLLLGASPGALGAIRGLWHSRVPLEAVGAYVFPEMMGLPQANQAFDDSGKLKDPALTERLKKLLLKFKNHIE